MRPLASKVVQSAKRPGMSAKVRAKVANRKRQRQSALEWLEPRTLLATLPAAVLDPTVGVRTLAGGARGTVGDQSSPSIAYNPVNPQQMVSVWTRTGGIRPGPYGPDTTVYVEGAWSVNGGQTWTRFAANASGSRPDPQVTSPPIPQLPQVTDASVAFDRGGRFYVLSVARRADSSSGALVLDRFNMTTAGPIPLGATTLKLWNTGADQTMFPPDFYTGVLKPTLVVDNTLLSYVNPATGATVTNPGAGNIYAIWTTITPPPPQNPPPNFHANSIEMWTSTNAGASFTATFRGNGINVPAGSAGLALNGGNNIGLQRPGMARATVSQGGAGAVPGQVTITWNDFGSDPNFDAINVVRVQPNAGGTFTRLGQSTVAATTIKGTIAGNVPPLFGTAVPVSFDRGIGPNPVIASDNTLGTISPFQGRLYVAYVDRFNGPQNQNLRPTDPNNQDGPFNDNTDIRLAVSTNGGLTWQVVTSKLNDDFSPTDGYTESTLDLQRNVTAGRPQFQPEVAVDPVTGTLAVSFLDARDDAARARVATYVATSIDGGASFGPQTFANQPYRVFDEVTRTNKTVGPVPDNYSPGNTNREATFGQGDRQALTFVGGQIYAAYSSNLNGGATAANGLNIRASKMLVAAGPRVVSSTMGPVGQVGDRLNDQRTADGTPQAQSLIVTFDRPVDVASFTTAGPTAEQILFAPDPATFVINNNGATNSPGTPPILPGTAGNGLWQAGGLGLTYANYDTGLENSGTVRTPPMALPAGVQTALRFDYTLETDVNRDAAVVSVLDSATGAVLGVVAANPGGTAQTGTATNLLDPTNGTRRAVVDLSPFAGRTVRLAFSFNTIDFIANGGAGWSIGNVTVYRPEVPADVRLEARDVNGALLPVQPTVTAITPLDTGAFGATTFRVDFTAQDTVGTYSYAIGPDIRTRVAYFNTALGQVVVGSPLDQNSDTRAGTVAADPTILPLPDDSYATPRPTGGVPFRGPYDTTTVPLIVPGPAVLEARNFPAPAAQVGLPINDLSTTTSSLTISGDPNQQITKLTVNLTITHTSTRDLQITLIAPDGARVPLAINRPQPPRPNGANFTNTTFDDEASLAISASNAPFNGVFRSDGFASGQGLLQQVGKPLNGQWRLEVVDQRAGGTGTLVNWSLTATTTTVSLDKGLGQVPVVFDRDMDPASMVGGVLQVLGPDGRVVPGPYTITAAPNLDPNYPDPDANFPRTYLVGFPAQAPSGSYSVVLSPDIASKRGDKLDTNRNAGLAKLRDVIEPQNGSLQTEVAVSTNVPVNILTNRTVSSSIDITDTYTIQALTLQLDIDFTDNPALTAVLVAPDGMGGTRRIRLFSGVGATGNRSNFRDTIFDDAATTPIQNGGPPFIGRYNPTDPLGVLFTPGNQQAVTGRWTLEITNASGVVQGRLNRWSLSIVRALPGTGLGEPNADRATVSGRVFTFDATIAQTSNSWTAVGPAGISGRGANLNAEVAGRMNSIAVDPSDPSGNTVYGASAAGGIWKTSNFLTNSPSGPTWVPLTDRSSAQSLNVTTLTIVPRNGDVNQSIIIAGTGDAPVLGAEANRTPLTSRGIGFLRSQDGGRTWDVLTSFDNRPAFASRTHEFAPTPGDPNASGSSVYKVIADPQITPQGVILYAAVSDTDPNGLPISTVFNRVGGIYISRDTGTTWTRLRAGQATDVILDQNSADAVSGELQIVHGAFRFDGVYFSNNQGQSFQIMAGNVGLPLIQNADSPQPQPVPVGLGTVFTPNSLSGRIVLAKPGLRANDPLYNLLVQDWLYVGVVEAGAVGSHFATTSTALTGLFVTKDRGQTWTQVPLPVYNTLPTNDANRGRIDPTGGPQTPAGSNFGLANYNIALTVDPTNAAVIYIGGTNEFGQTGLIRVDTTFIQDTRAFYLSNYDPGAGVLQSNNTGAVGGSIRLSNPTQGIPLIQPPYDPRSFPTINLVRDFNQFFNANATILVTNTAQFFNNGTGARWVTFDQALAPNPFATAGTLPNRPTRGIMQVLTLPDPLTGKTRLIVANDNGVYTALDEGDGSLLGSLGDVTDGTTSAGNVRFINGSRNGNLQIAQLYAGASAPSDLAAQLSVLQGSLYAATQDGGLSRSVPNQLLPGQPGYGNLNWVATQSSRSDYGDVAVQQNYRVDPVTGQVTSPGTNFAYAWPSSLSASGRADQFGASTDFFQVDTVSRTLGLIQAAGGGDVPDGQWPYRLGLKFTVNPINANQVVMSSNVGRVFFTPNQGVTWTPIGQPGNFGNPNSPVVLAFGSPTASVGTPPTDQHILAGTTAGRVYVTYNRGGVWRDITGNLPINSPAVAIAANPTPGTREVYVLTSRGVFHLADSAAATPTWRTITGNLYNITRQPFGNAALTERALVGLNGIQRDLTSLAVDWRYVVPDNPALAPGQPRTDANTHPILYVGGEVGVFRSIVDSGQDNGASWSLFPDSGPGSLNGAPVEMGGLAAARVTDLDLALGDIDPTTGRPLAARLRDPRLPFDPATNPIVSRSQNLLLASTFGRGAYGIRLAPITLTNELYPGLQPGVLRLSPTDPTPNGSDSGLTAAGRLDRITNVVEPFIEGLSEPSAFGNTVAVQLLDLNSPLPNGGFRVVGTGTTDTAGRFRIQVNPGAFRQNGDPNGPPLDQVPGNPSPFPIRLGVQATNGSGTKGNIAVLDYQLRTVRPPSANAPTLVSTTDTGRFSVDNVTFAIPSLTITSASGAAFPAGTTIFLQRSTDGTNFTTVNGNAVTGVGGFVVSMATTAVTLVDTTLSGITQPLTAYHYKAIIVDQAANYSDTAPNAPNTAALIVYRDTTAPARPRGPGAFPNPQLAAGDDTGTPNDGITNKTQPRITGVVETNPNPPSSVPNPANAGTIVRLFDRVNNTLVFLGSAVADPVTGAFIVQPGFQVSFNPTNTSAPFTTAPFPLRLSDGVHTLIVTAEDLAGNVSANSDPLVITVRTTTPAVPNLRLVTPPPVSADTYVTNNTRPPFTGSGADQNITVNLVMIAAPAGFGQTLPFTMATTTARFDGQFTFSQTQLLVPDGAYRFQAEAVDIAGNTSLSNVVTVTVDTGTPAEQPTLRLHPADDTGRLGDNATYLRRPRLTNNPAFPATPGLFVEILQATPGPGGMTNYTVRAGGPNDPVKIVVDASGSFQAQLPFDLTNGPITLVSRFRDQAGNVGATVSAPLDLRIINVMGDYDRDGRAELASYRNNAQFLTFNLVNGGVTTQFLGLAGDIPVQGDFDGDGRTDFAVYRPSNGTWAVLGSQSGLFTTQLSTQVQAGDVPVPGDYDGDGLADPAIFRPATGEWFHNPSSGGPTVRTPFGQAGDIPVPADFTGDFQTDVAVYRPSTSQFRYLNAKTNTVVTQMLGLAGDVPVPLDYSGDGRADFAVYRPSNSLWVYLDSANQTITTQMLGLAGDVPVPLDYNGDGRADFAVYRPNAKVGGNSPTWAIFYTNTGGVQVQLFGQRATDVPVAAPPAFRLPILIGPGGYQPYGGTGAPPARAMAVGGDDDPIGSTQPVVLAPVPTPTPIGGGSQPVNRAPRVLGARLETGPNGNITAFVVQFDEALDKMSATRLANYSVRPNREGLPAVRVRSARYDAATMSVSLTPHGPLTLGRAYRLTVRDVTDAQGLPIGGDTPAESRSFTTVVRRPRPNLAGRTRKTSLPE